MKLLLSLISLILIASSCHSFTISKDDGSSTEPGNFDFYLFVQQWIYSYCDSEESSCIANKEKEAFTIHGLWPESTDGSYPAYCTGPSFDLNNIADLEDQLNNDWPSLTEVNSDFWKSEFTKHGTCAVSAGPITDEHDYFAAGIKLYSTYNLTHALASENIVPSSENSYDAEDIANAIHSQYGVKIGMQCNDNYLQTIVLCINKDLSVMDCPSIEGMAICSGNVTIPSGSN